MRSRWLLILCSLVVQSGVAQAASPGDLYVAKCGKCHGAFLEDKTGSFGRPVAIPVVMTPTGPNLTGIYGQPAGRAADYRYSNAFRAAAPDLVWDAPTLDRWLADSQKMIPGSYMFFKLKQPERGTIIDYLKSNSR